MKKTLKERIHTWNVLHDGEREHEAAIDAEVNAVLRQVSECLRDTTETMLDSIEKRYGIRVRIAAIDTHQSTTRIYPDGTQEVIQRTVGCEVHPIASMWTLRGEWRGER